MAPHQGKLKGHVRMCSIVNSKFYSTRNTLMPTTSYDIIYTHIYYYSARAGSLMGLHANIVCLLSVMLSPYMPQVSQQIQEQLQVRLILLQIAECKPSIMRTI